eukprot:jgi/Orpsp1_1/1187658/evm.model.d7180000059276.1
MVKKRSNEDGNDFRSETDNKKRKVIDEKDIIDKFLCSNFFIDKSLIIKEFLEESSSIICVTRPSGYGKTVNLNMMRYFFEMNYENDEISENKKFFENLNIAKEKIDGESCIDHYQGKYPVVYLNFDNFKIKSNYNKTLDNFKVFIKLLYKNYNIEIGNLSNREKEMWKKFREGNSDINESDLNNSIMILCDCLKKLLKKEIVLLIDNYDSPILNAINTEFYDRFYSFYYRIFDTLFNYDKEKRFLFKTFITGKVNSNFFKDFDYKNYSIEDNKYYKYYSITDSELRKVITELKLENRNEIYEKYCIFSFKNPTNINNSNE